MTRLLVNDMLTAIPGTRTFWSDLRDWFDMVWVGGSYDELANEGDAVAEGETHGISLIIRNATYFGPLETSKRIPTISLLQDIMPEGPQREMQGNVMASSSLSGGCTVFNSEYTLSKYPASEINDQNGGVVVPLHYKTIPLPIDFSLFEPGNAMGLQQSLSLPDGCVCWVGACQGAAGQIKGWDIFLKIVRINPDISFVGVFKDALPEYAPPNLRMYVRLTHEELVKIIGACRVGLCTSRVETQHLAGIEMGACGLPMVAEGVGCYWNRRIPGAVMSTLNCPQEAPRHFSDALRSVLSNSWTKVHGDPQKIRTHWQKDFDRPVIRAAWEKLVNEIESQKEKSDATV